MEGFDVGAAVVTTLTAALGYVAVIIPAGLLIWAALFGIGIAKKAAKKAAS
jgi:hypothetical protein